MGNSSWKVPLPTSDVIMKDKKVDMVVLSYLIMSSKRNNRQEEDHRFLYEYDMEKAIDELCKITGYKRDTIRKIKIKRLLEVGIITKNEYFGESVYKIYPKSDGKLYTLVDSTILEKLIELSDSVLIKVYIVLNYLVRARGELPRKISQGHICQSVGLSPSSTKTIRGKVVVLEKEKLIKLYKRRVDSIYYYL